MKECRVLQARLLEQSAQAQMVTIDPSSTDSSAHFRQPLNFKPPTKKPHTVERALKEKFGAGSAKARCRYCELGVPKHPGFSETHLHKDGHSTVCWIERADRLAQKAEARRERKAAAETLKQEAAIDDIDAWDCPCGFRACRQSDCNGVCYKGHLVTCPLNIPEPASVEPPVLEVASQPIDPEPEPAIIEKPAAIVATTDIQAEADGRAESSPINGRLGGRPHTAAQHGTARKYRLGCRCQQCKAAKAEARLRAKAKGTKKSLTSHQQVQRLEQPSDAAPEEEAAKPKPEPDWIKERQKIEARIMSRKESLTRAEICAICENALRSSGREMHEDELVKIVTGVSNLVMQGLMALLIIRQEISVLWDEKSKQIVMRSRNLDPPKR